MNDIGSTLIVHCGARRIAREELKSIPIPEGTKTHQPLSHYEIVEVLEEALSFRFLKVVRDEYAVSADGMKMFGVMDLNTEFEGGRFSIGLRNSNDKSMRLALTAGLRVTVCDNMAFSGDFTPLLHKHTRNLELRDSISIAVDRIQRGFDPLAERITAMKEFGLTDNDVRLFVYRAFLEREIRGIPRNLMTVVHDHYFEPKYGEFEARNLWSLSNAFTSAFKTMAPMKQFEVTARLGTFLSNEQERLKRRAYNGLELARNIRAAEVEYPNVATSVAIVNGNDPTASDEDESVTDRPNGSLEDINLGTASGQDNDKEDMNEVLSEIDECFEEGRNYEITEEFERKLVA